MTLDTAIVLAAIVLALVWPVHQQLELRALRHSLRRHRDQLAQHRRAIVQLQGAAVRPPTSIGQPMPTVGRPLARGGIVKPQPQGREHGCELVATQAGLRSLRATSDPDQTLRLVRPPALSDIEAVLTQAGRALTVTEMAAQLGRQTWDCLPELDRLLKAGAIRTVPGHTAGRTAYELADPAESTERMPRGMSLLPGVVR